MIGVLITILISVIGLFSAMQLQLTAVSNTHSAYFLSQAAVLTNGLVDQIRADQSSLARRYLMFLRRF
jgi:Tfp pilus assembly protein PilV